jgi:hypothetical protein
VGKCFVKYKGWLSAENPALNARKKGVEVFLENHVVKIPGLLIVKYQKKGRDSIAQKANEPAPGICRDAAEAHVKEEYTKMDNEIIPPPLQIVAKQENQAGEQRQI